MPFRPPPPPQKQELVAALNQALQRHPDKDWNYSRILFVLKQLDEVPGPYVLVCEVVKRNDPGCQKTLRSVAEEIEWGDRHSSELGILEIVSLRLNKALMETCAAEPEQPVIRVQKKTELGSHGASFALWYEVKEVGGEEFENR